MQLMKTVCCARNFVCFFLLINYTVEAAAEAAGVFAFAEAAGIINYYVSPRKSEDNVKEEAEETEEESESEQSGYP